VVRHERRVLVDAGHPDRRLERVQAAEAERGDHHGAGTRWQRRAHLRGAERQPAIVVANGLHDEERRACQQPVQAFRVGGIHLVHGGHPHPGVGVVRDDEADRLGLAVADHDAVPLRGRLISEERGVVAAPRYHRRILVRKALGAALSATHDVNVRRRCRRLGNGSVALRPLP